VRVTAAPRSCLQCALRAGISETSPWEIPSKTALMSATFFFFKQKTAYEIGLGIPAEPLFRSASIKLIQASAVLDLTEDDFDFLTSNKVWIATDRSRARRCVEACVYGTLDFVGYPRFPAPVEFIA